MSDALLTVLALALLGPAAVASGLAASTGRERLAWLAVVLLLAYISVASWLALRQLGQ